MQRPVPIVLTGLSLPVLLRWGSSKACGSSACDGGAGVVCQGLAPFIPGDRDMLVLVLLTSPPEDEVDNGLVEALPRRGKVLEGLYSELGWALVAFVAGTRPGECPGPCLGGLFGGGRGR